MKKTGSNLSVTFLTLVLAILLLEQSTGPFAIPYSIGTSTEDAPAYYCFPPEILPGQFLASTENRPNAPVQILKEPILAWRSNNHEKSLTLSFSLRSVPFPVQDVERCPSVSFELFPFHVFL